LSVFPNWEEGRRKEEKQGGRGGGREGGREEGMERGREGGRADLFGIDQNVPVAKHGTRPQVWAIPPHLGREGGREVNYRVSGG
jgi:hypothetical protein